MGSKVPAPDRPGREGRLARFRRNFQTVRRDPRQFAPLIRTSLIDIWRARGGGLYGLGYLIAFFWFEVTMLIDEFSGSEDAASFALGQILEWLFRIGFLSFVNALQAFLWPVYVLQLAGGAGIILLVGAYVGFEYGLRPWIEGAFPELRDSERESASANPDQ